MNNSKTLTICYTDIKGSTELNNKIGNEEMSLLKNEHFRIGKQLIKNNSGNFIKSLGDGLLCTFSNPANALKFSTEFQCIEKDRPNIDKWNFDLKIGMSHKEVLEKEEDVDGIGANLAKRVETIANVGEILLDRGALNALVSSWGETKAMNYCIAFGEKELKGFGEQEIWKFNWNAYNIEEKLMSKLVRNHLEKAGFEITNTESVPLNSGGKIFWPVVQRSVATAIHKGQMEAIRLLTFCDWEVHLFIADSRNLFSLVNEDVDKFSDSIIAYAEKINLKISEIELMSEIYSKYDESVYETLKQLKYVMTRIKVEDAFKYLGKTYENKDKFVMNKNILEFLRPLLTINAFISFYNTYPKANIMVIAGYDERIQWNHLLECDPAYARINMIFNQELKKREHLMIQTKDWPNWRSKRNCKDEMEESNLTEWLFNLFVILPNFPASEFDICNIDQICQRNDCKKDIKRCKDISKVREKLLNLISNKFGW